MKYVSGEEILLIHARIIDEIGGIHGVRDLGLLKSLVHRPRGSFGGTEIYPDIWQKAAAYLEAMATYHVFADGNKRTAIAVTARFLYLNKFHLKATNEEVVVFVLKVATKEVTIPKIALWLKKNSKK